MNLENLKNLSIVELKAMIYDLIVQQEQISNTIKLINQIIVEKQNQPPAPAQPSPDAPEEKEEKEVSQETK